MTQNNEQEKSVKQLRLVVHTEDYERALRFYRDVLGLEQRVAFEGEGDARVAILDAGLATLELANPEQSRMIDGVEAEGRPSAPLRVAFEVEDSAETTEKLVDAGAELIAAPRTTPWQSVNSRIHGPAGLEVTLFQELEGVEERSERPGFVSPQIASPE
ncbi:MAG TPA: VOC family protein [Candidatus Agrococcus pullicola]|uniref:VOC family protein n=1 Tax=Candidatus Agrococcus pullicola TaxID=2838429 RepID=A0A9D1YVJ4_9MICO|nr:VOC family protein [Candidatus Agrococcus pullicola]